MYTNSDTDLIIQLKVAYLKCLIFLPFTSGNKCLGVVSERSLEFIPALGDGRAWALSFHN